MGTPHSERAPLAWEIWHKFEDIDSGMQVVINRARVPGPFDIYRYSFQLGRVMPEATRIQPFIPIMFDPDSIKLQSQEPLLSFDYAGVVSKLTRQAIEHVHKAVAENLTKRQEDAYTRDLDRAKRQRPKDQQRVGNTGKTARERQKKRGDSKQASGS